MQDLNSNCQTYLNINRREMLKQGAPPFPNGAAGAGRAAGPPFPNGAAAAALCERVSAKQHRLTCWIPNISKYHNPNGYSNHLYITVATNGFPNLSSLQNEHAGLEQQLPEMLKQGTPPFPNGAAAAALCERVSAKQHLTCWIPNISKYHNPNGYSNHLYITVATNGFPNLSSLQNEHAGLEQQLPEMLKQGTPPFPNGAAAAALCERVSAKQHLTCWIPNISEYHNPNGYSNHLYITVATNGFPNLSFLQNEHAGLEQQLPNILEYQPPGDVKTRGSAVSQWRSSCRKSSRRRSLQLLCDSIRRKTKPIIHDHNHLQTSSVQYLMNAWNHYKMWFNPSHTDSMSSKHPHNHFQDDPEHRLPTAYKRSNSIHTKLRSISKLHPFSLTDRDSPVIAAASTTYQIYPDFRNKTFNGTRSKPER